MESPLRSTVAVALLVVPLLLFTVDAQRAGDPVERIRKAEIKADLFALDPPFKLASFTFTSMSDAI